MHKDIAELSWHTEIENYGTSSTKRVIILGTKESQFNISFMNVMMKFNSSACDDVQRIHRIK